MKRILTVLLSILMLAVTVFGVTACIDKDEVSDSIRISAMTGPTALGMLKLREDSKDSDKFLFDDFYVNAEAITPLLVQKQLDIVALPTNQASIFFNKASKDSKIKVLCINTLGVLYIMDKGGVLNPDDIKSLKGKTVFMPGRGTTPEYTLKYVLEKNNLTCGEGSGFDVSLDFKTDGQAVIAAMATSSEAVALLPQPAATAAMINPSAQARQVFDLAAEWEKVADGTIVTGVLVVRTAFLNANKALVNEFLEAYKQSIEFMSNPANIDTAAQLFVDSGIAPNLNVAKQAIPKCVITYISGSQMKEKVTAYLNALYGKDADFIGGEMPTNDFFYLP